MTSAPERRSQHYRRRSAASSSANITSAIIFRTLITPKERQTTYNDTNMCKIWALIYNCSHEHNIRLSDCLGHNTYRHRTRSLFTSSSSKQLRKACNGSLPALKFKVDHSCGPCSRELPERELGEKADEIKARYQKAEDSRRLMAEEEYQREIYDLHRQFPGVCRRACSPNEQALRDIHADSDERRQRSRLREEVFPDDIDDSMEKYLSDWATDTWRQDLPEEWRPTEQEGPESITMSWTTSKWDGIADGYGDGAAKRSQNITSTAKTANILE